MDRLQKSDGIIPLEMAEHLFWCFLKKLLTFLIMYFTYILQSLKDNRYYYGHTNNLENRVDQHNKGKVKSTKDVAHSLFVILKNLRQSPKQ